MQECGDRLFIMNAQKGIHRQLRTGGRSNQSYSFLSTIKHR